MTTYKKVETYPSGSESATIYLHGLVCMCFRNDFRLCTAAANHVSPSHTPRFGIFERSSCRPILELTPQYSQTIEIRAVNSLNVPIDDVSVYTPPPPHPPPPPPVNRFSFTEHCLDLEVAHGAFLTKTPAVLGPMFKINNGLFSSYKLTVSEFELKLGTRKVFDGTIGLAIVADLFLSSSDKILIFSIPTPTATPTPIATLSLAGGEQYDIAITNACTNPMTCRFDPTSPDPRVRSDFSLHYEATTVPLVNQFGLFKKTGPSGNSMDLGMCIPPEAGYYSVTTFSDPAPCAPVCFGESNTLP